MNPVLKSLEEITTGYSVFEKDQVLTHDQLNSVADYFDDQTRLTRIKLLGVGIVCGLRVSVQGSNVQLTKGAAVTTDGDLLYFAVDTVFDKFKPYDNSNPVYGPFYVGEEIVELYELLAQGTTDERSAALTTFSATTGSPLNKMAAVLFMEGYVKDEDLCSGTDCDNLGKDRVNTIKLLLIEKSSVELLKRSIATPHQAASALSEIVANRALFTPSITSPALLAANYRAACNSIHIKLTAELPKLYPNCATFLGDVLASDTANGWIAKLNTLRASFGVTDSSIQYYYDFLKDLVETYNNFRELLFGETTWCCPDTENFPKHLLLGNVVPGADLNEDRIGFYPSPIASRTVEQLSYAKFLVRKLDTMIQTFQLPSSAGAIRITPSQFEDSRPDERAIPYYYQVNSTNPIQKSWNYRLHLQGMDAWNYSYNAAAYGAQGGAANPLTSQIGRFSFLRIEGHLGQNVSTVTNTIENEIQARNLPFTVHSVLLGADKTKIVKKPGTHYTDLHRLHHVLRQDVFYQLEDVSQFSEGFKQQVDDAVKEGTVTNSPDDNDGSAVKDIAAEKHSKVTTKAASARAKLDRSYSQYKADTSWKADLSDTMTASGEFKRDLSKVVKTEFTTPFDSLISNTHIYWLEFLDKIIKDGEDKEDDRLLFAKFVTEHPGIEHFAGVTRGGTFVLVYDTDNKVVADFMLPYPCHDAAQEESTEPPLAKPDWKSSWIVDSGIKINPSLDKYFTSKIGNFVKEVIDPKINLQNDYFDFFKGSWKTMIDVFGNVSPGGVRAGDEIKYTDTLLGALVNDARAGRPKAQLLKEKANSPELPERTATQYKEQAKESQADLAKSIVITAQYVSDSRMSVLPGSEGFRAMMEMSGIMDALTEEGARNSLKTGLKRVKEGTTGNPGLVAMLEGMINT